MKGTAVFVRLWIYLFALTYTNKGKVKPSAPPMKQEQKGGVHNSPLWKERQTRDYLKANGLCFYCREPFDANHIKSYTKRPQQQLNALALNDGCDVILTEEVLNQLAVEDALASDFCQLSLNALAGTKRGCAMKIRALVDSGSSHSFISKSFVTMLGIPTVPMPPQQVRFANGV